MFTPQEVRNLSTLLARAVNPDNALLHGFLFGLAIIPDIIMPIEWFPNIHGYFGCYRLHAVCMNTVAFW